MESSPDLKQRRWKAGSGGSGELNFYKHYLGDYARDTASLSLVEHGVYRILLDTYYATERPLPARNKDLYLIAKAMTGPERKAVDRVSEMFFPVSEDGLRHNTRADKEIANASAYASAQAMRAHMRWHPPGISEGNAHHSHSQTPDKKQTPLPPSGAFLRFWGIWPSHSRKQSRGKCWELWLKKDFDLEAEQIISHVEALKSSADWRKDDGQFIPAPLVYLGQRRWEGAVDVAPGFKVDL